MPIKYFYIDDDPQKTIEETARGLSVHEDKLIVKAFQHKKWDDELDFLINHLQDIDGLILDWNLSKKNDAGDIANYEVEALAAQIRKLCLTRKIKNEFPIVLCSADYSFRTILQKKPLTKGLFDTYYEKDDFDIDRENIILQLIAMAKGYKVIEENSTVNNLLGLSNEEECDYRILEYLSFLKMDLKVYEVAYFILNGIIKVQGVLIDECLLASRLGVDLKQNVDEWKKLKEVLKENNVAYKGIYSDGWTRWWNSELMNWWNSISKFSLGSLSGPERVVILNKKFDLKLLEVNKTAKSKSDLFWVIDQKTKSPIALQDAILTVKDLITRYPWEDDEYYSVDSALLEDVKNIHPLDRDKVASLKVQHSRVRP